MAVAVAVAVSEVGLVVVVEGVEEVEGARRLKGGQQRRLRGLLRAKEQ